MAAKRSSQATRSSSNRSAWPAWVWMALGVLLGIAFSTVVIIKGWAPMLRNKNLPQPNPEATAPRETDPGIADANSKSKDPKNEPKRTIYDFYTVLPEMEVVIPDTELSDKARAEAAKRQQLAANTQNQNPATPPISTPATTTTVPADTSARYQLQVGSYPEAKTADEIKAKLALLGFTAKVQQVTIDNKTWHRVRVGPYSNASDVETAKKSLSENGISAIALKEAGTH